jgi:hypothetical protein
MPPPVQESDQYGDLTEIYSGGIKKLLESYINSRYFYFNS